jgi:DNA primase
MDLMQIKRVNLRRYASEKYGIECNRRGYAKCPFHPDKNPSFQISLYKEVWRFTDWHLDRGHPDFSGTIVDLVSKMEGISISEAILKLKEEFENRLIEEFIQKRRKRHISFKDMES